MYARSWRVDRTVPYTRADIGTGDQNSNLYRAFFGRRYDHGEALQVSAEQFTTQPDRALPSSDALNLMGRFGITHGPWSADAFIEHTHRNRAPWRGTGDADETTQIIDGIETQRSTAYLRLGNGDPDRGRWFQAIASAHDYHGRPRSTTTVGSGRHRFNGGRRFGGVREPVLAHRRHYARTRATQRRGALSGGWQPHVPRRIGARVGRERTALGIALRGREELPESRALRRNREALAAWIGSRSSARRRAREAATSTACSMSRAQEPYSTKPAHSFSLGSDHSLRPTPRKQPAIGWQREPTFAQRQESACATCGFPAGSCVAAQPRCSLRRSSTPASRGLPRYGSKERQRHARRAFAAASGGPSTPTHGPWRGAIPPASIVRSIRRAASCTSRPTCSTSFRAATSGCSRRCRTSTGRAHAFRSGSATPVATARIPATRVQAGDSGADRRGVVSVPQSPPGEVRAGARLQHAAADAVLRRTMGLLELTMLLWRRNLRGLI